MKDELIRDRLVVGIQDLALSERLQLEPDLTLDKAKQLIRQRESVKIQQDSLQKPTAKEEGSLDAVRKPTPEESYQQYHRHQYQQYRQCHPSHNMILDSVQCWNELKQLELH